MKRCCGLLSASLCLSMFLSARTAVAEEDGQFARSTMDLGVVVSDVDKSVEFYTKAIGFQEIKGFIAPAQLVGDAGLADYQTLKIRVLVLADEESATRLKLMEVPGVKSKKADNQFIHSQLGFSYLTVFVNDTNAAIERLDKAGVKPAGKGPAALPKSLGEGVFLTVVKDPDGNIVELVGPKK